MDEGTARGGAGRGGAGRNTGDEWVDYLILTRQRHYFFLGISLCLEELQLLGERTG